MTTTRLLVAALLVLGITPSALAKDAPAPTLEMLRSKDDKIRARAAWDVGEVRPIAKGTVEVLAALLSDDVERVRMGAVSSLWELGKAAAVAVPELRTALRDETPFVRMFAAAALGRMDDEGLSALEALIANFKDEHSHARDYAMQAVAAFGPRAATAIPALVEVLGSGDNLRTATKALGRIGVATPASEASLVALAGHADQYLRAAVMDTLGTTGGAASMPALVVALQDEQDTVRVAAAGALRKVSTRIAVTSMIGVVERQGGIDAVAGAASVLREIGPDARLAIPALEKSYIRPARDAVQAALEAIRAER